MKKNIVKVFGTGTTSQQFITSTIHKYLNNAMLNYDIDIIDDINTFLELKLESIPAVQLNNESIVTLGKNNELKDKLRKFLSDILSRENFGSLKKVVVPVDFSETSTNAFMFAHRFATQIDAVTSVLHVHSSIKEKVEIEKRFDQFISQVDFDWKSDLLKASLIEKNYKIGHVNNELLNLITTSKPELVIMGSTGHSIQNNLFGSVSLSVIKKSPSNVLLIPKDAKYKKIKKIVFAFNNPNNLKKHLELTNHYANLFNAKMTYLYVRQDDAYDKDLIDFNPSENTDFLTLHNRNFSSALETFVEENPVEMLMVRDKQNHIFDSVNNQNNIKKLSLYTEVPLFIIK
ncbi:MAG: universal stress protein [Saprospiraceae bacterium]|nr:universal stress protein [Bacteroidia bacterium]NNL93912.1 universal stress protein [Saprospiraceae bacterium]